MRIFVSRRFAKRPHAPLKLALDKGRLRRTPGGRNLGRALGLIPQTLRTSFVAVAKKLGCGLLMLAEGRETFTGQFNRLASIFAVKRQPPAWRLAENQ